MGNRHLNEEEDSDLVVAFIEIEFADSPYTASWGEDISADCTNGDIVINLPTAVGNAGKTLWVTKSDVSENKVDSDGNGTETINGSLIMPITTQYVSRTLRSNGANVVLR